MVIDTNLSIDLKHHKGPYCDEGVRDCEPRIYHYVGIVTVIMHRSYVAI